LLIFTKLENDVSGMVHKKQVTVACKTGSKNKRVFKRMGLRLQDDQCPESRAEVELRRNSRVYCTAILLPVYICSRLEQAIRN